MNFSLIHGMEIAGAASVAMGFLCIFVVSFYLCIDKPKYGVPLFFGLILLVAFLIGGSM